MSLALIVLRISHLEANTPTRGTSERQSRHGRSESEQLKRSRTVEPWAKLTSVWAAADAPLAHPVSGLYLDVGVFDDSSKKYIYVRVGLV